MIGSVEEMLALLEQDTPEARDKLRWDTADEGVWSAILDRFPHEVETVVFNKRLPDPVLLRLVRHPDARIRTIVAHKRQLTREMFGKRLTDDAL